MKTETQSTPRQFVETNLKPPIDQKTECLYQLMLNYKKGVTRRQLMINCWILNAPHLIMCLRRDGLEIINEPMNIKNKYGRGISYTYYKLHDFNEAVILYNKLNPRTDD